MFERFTDRARQAVVLAYDEVRILKHDHISTEHILLGLIREQDGLGARVLRSLDITLEQTREHVVDIVGTGVATPNQIPFTPAADSLFKHSTEEADELDDDLVASHHLLLGLLRQDDSVANRVLGGLGGDAQHLRDMVFASLDVAPEEHRVPSEIITRLSRGTSSADDADLSAGAAIAACSFCGQRERHMFGSFPPTAGEALICDLCLDLFHGCARGG